jgi:hypothetical protein
MNGDCVCEGVGMYWNGSYCIYCNTINNNNINNTNTNTNNNNNNTNNNNNNNVYSIFDS